MIFPNQTEFAARARRGNLVPVSCELLADAESPVSAYAKIRKFLREQDHASHTFLLESVEGGEKIGRYSILGGAPHAILRAWGPRVELQTGAAKIQLPETDPLLALKNYMARFKPVPDPTLPRFTGGAVGFLGYDAVTQFEKVPDMPGDDIHAPDMVFMVTDTLLIFDHVRHTIRVLVNAHLDAGAHPIQVYAAAVAKIGALCAALAEPLPARVIPAVLPAGEPAVESNVPQPEFVRRVEKAKEYIRAGDIIQVVLSQRFQQPCAADPLDVYRALRFVNPSPYMFCLELGGSALVGSSPEVHVRGEHGRVEVRPIAGTRPRGRNEEDDLRLEKDLLADAKERAEHVMLVDLARNDIGRVCEYGSVRVPELMVVERYSHVMHIVSDVTGRLRPDVDVYDLMRATFPAGTVSGAPKVRAMQIIAEIEGVRRGPYAGAVGYFSFDGNLDSCITIRTVVLDQGMAFVQAGAGIVADSDPESEYEETRNKARGMFKALALAEQFAERQAQS